MRRTNTPEELRVQREGSVYSSAMLVTEDAGMSARCAPLARCCASRPVQMLVKVCARVSLCLGVVYFVYGVVVSLFGIPEVIQSAAYLLPASLLLFTIFHSFYTLGWRCFLAFVPLTLVLSWAFEELGANTVFPYGGLKYSSMLPGRIGSVPVEVPFSYLMVLYPALCLADLLLNGDCWKRHTQLDASAWTVRGWLHDFFRTVLTALLMCGWLVVADPTAVSWCGLWTYTGTESAGGSVLFFGVPAQVVVSWFFVFFVIIFIYLRTESWIKVRSFGPSSAGEALWALFAWLLLSLVSISLLLPQSLCVIAFFSMFFPLLVGMVRLLTTVWALSNTESIDQYGSMVVPIRRSAPDGGLEDAEREFLLNSEFDTDDVLTFEDTHYDDDEVEDSDLEFDDRP
mmetsp:Transcript_6934/g.17501  ORF Transcript_6934/g.17501 Transcript_6934/m.17501 type:complete len:399 (+) Transcript_6934:45-1241(+)